VGNVRKLEPLLQGEATAENPEDAGREEICDSLLAEQDMITV